MRTARALLLWILGEWRSALDRRDVSPATRMYVYVARDDDNRVAASIVESVVADFADERLAAESRSPSTGRLVAILDFTGCPAEMDIVLEGLSYKLENADLCGEFRSRPCALCGRHAAAFESCDLRTTRTSELMPKWVMEEWEGRWRRGCFG